MIKVAIVGTGFLARTRARCWKRVFGAQFECIVAARDGAKAAAFAREHALDGAGTIDEVLVEGDGVIIAKGQPLFRVTPDEKVEIISDEEIALSRRAHTTELVKLFI